MTVTELAGWGLILALVSLPGLLIPEVMWAMFGGLSYRTPERVEPSPRRYRVVRMGSATTFLIGVVILIGAFWPGTADEKAIAAFTASLIGIGLFIAGVIISVVLRKRRRFREKRYEDDDLPPDEPSDLSYGFDYFGIIVYLVLLVVVSGSFIGMEQRKQDRIDELTGDKPLTEEQQRSVDETLQMWNTLHVDRYPVLDAVPEGAVIAMPRLYDPIDAANETPRVVWHQSKNVTDVAAPMPIGEADIAVNFSAFTCHVTSIVIVESETTVAVGFVVDGANAVPEEGTNVAPCLSGPVLNAHRFLVDLPELGDRELVNLGGGRLIDWPDRID
ncbi:hypothetical protein BH10ACT7_BH10ACT7_26910 [soil metagenome]